MQTVPGTVRKCTGTRGMNYRSLTPKTGQDLPPLRDSSMAGQGLAGKCVQTVAGILRSQNRGDCFLEKGEMCNQQMPILANRTGPHRGESTLHGITIETATGLDHLRSCYGVLRFRLHRTKPIGRLARPGTSLRLRTD